MSTQIPDLGSPPTRLDPELRKWLVKAAEHIRELRGFTGDLAGQAGSGGGGGGTVVITGAPPPAPAPGPADPPDPTPPPTPSGVVVTAGLAAIYIETDDPTFTQGHGYARTLVYGAKYPGTGPLPTFGSAVLVHEFIGEIGSFPSDLGTQWHIWVKWLTEDDVESSIPSGGTNGHVATTGKIGNADLGPLIVEAGNLASGAVTATKLAAGAVGLTAFAAGITPVEVVATLPATGNFVGRTVVLTTDGKLYRYTGSGWTATVASSDIAGQLLDTQIAALAASKITGQLTNAQLQSIAAAKLTGQITSTQITDGAISTPKLAAGAVTANEIAADTITAAQIAAGAITAAELAAGSVTAAKIVAGAVTTTALAAGAVTANELAANSVVAGKIAAGAVNADQIAAGAIRTSKMLIAPSAGGFVNPDPLLQDAEAWVFVPFTGSPPTYYPGFNAGPGLINAWDKIDGLSAEILGPAFPVSAARTYQIESTIYQWTSATPTHFLGVAFYDAAGTLIQGFTAPTGWPSAGTYHYYGRLGETSPVGATKYTHTFGANATAKIPTNAVTAKVLILGSFNNAGVRWSWGGAQVREIVPGELIVDGAITANKIAANAIAVGTAAIQNGAIVNAMIANATIDDAKIATLSVSKLTAGSLNVGAFIQSSGYIAGVTGFRFEGSGFAELGAASIRGQLTAAQIDSRNLTIRDAAGNVIFDSGGARVIDGLRTTNPNPQDWSAGETFFFKSAATLGLSTPSSYGVLRTVRPYGVSADLSGGAVNQWFEGDGLVWFRRSTGATTWSAWEAVPNGTITPANISTFIAAATIGSAYISDLSASKITAGNIQAGGYVRSTSYTPGAGGWSINADGSAEFRNVTVRGDVEATSVSSASGTFGTITAGYLRNASNSTSINLNATGSQDFLRAGNGAVRITADGDAYFTKSLGTGTWTGSVSLIEVQTTPIFAYLTPEVEIIIDTGINIPRGSIYERTLSCRLGAMINSYSPGESSGLYIGNVQYKAEVVLRAPFFANNIENAGQNPYDTGNQRALIRVRLQLFDRDNKTDFSMTSIAWTLDTVG